VLAAISFVIQLAGIRLLYLNKQGSLALLQGTAQLPVTHIVTEVPWYTAEVADLFYERVFFYVGEQAAFEELVSRFHRAGIRRFAWVPFDPSSIEPTITLADFTVQREGELLFEIVPAAER
jgi:hypothetical protein